MEAGTRDSSQQPTTAEEEALKRNTDCVYFLASPLTCKKGSECEYRHSEYARVNPRDCRYWLNSNCLNPKCSFRHPPLDGLLGTTMATSTGTTMATSAGITMETSTGTTMATSTGASPLSQNTTSTRTPTAQTSSGKQPVPCIFFQKGLCLKGDRCAFMHGPPTVGNAMPQPSAPKVVAPVSEPQILKNAFGGLVKCVQQQKTHQVNMPKPVEAQPSEILAAKAETAQLRNGVAVHKNVPQPIMLDNELPRYKPTKVTPVNSGNSISRSQGNRQIHVLDDRNDQSGKDADEFLGESSPGFDVLVDDELRESDYYRNEDEFERTRRHEGRHLNSLNEFDYGSADSRGYESYGRVQDRYAWEQRRSSSERISEGPAVPERRGVCRADNPNLIEESDLRHLLSKQRRLNGSRSVISPDHNGDMNRRDDRKHHVEDLRCRSWRDSRHFPSHDRTLSSRLQGRISLPQRSSPDNHNDIHSDREFNRGRNWGRTSPGRQPISSHQGRFQDRTKRRSREDLNTEERNFRSMGSRRDDMDNNTLDFTGPKRLAELKSTKISDSSEDQKPWGQHSFSHVKQNNPMTEKFGGRQEYEDSVSFEGPKPLSVILKRKRETNTAVSGSGTVSSDGDENNRRELGEIFEENSRTTANTETQTDLPFDSEKEASHHSIGSKEEPSSTATMVRMAEDGLISTRLTYGGQSYHAQKESEIDKEDTSIDKMMKDQEFENYVDQRDGEADYEQVDGVDSKIEEDATEDPEEEYLDDEDGDDFTKRIGVMLS